MLLVELSHTAHTTASTGIQQVCRNLFAELGQGALAIVHDPWQGCWRSARKRELERLEPRDDAGAARRKSEAWTLGEKLAGRMRMLCRQRAALPKEAKAVLMPEFVMSRCLRALPKLRRALPELPFLAVFHDAIALRMPELSSRATVERFPEYIAALARMDGVAAVSEASRRELLAHWLDMGIDNPPPVSVIPLGVERPPLRAGPVTSRVNSLRILCVSTLEPRKNHLALLDAAERLWSEGLVFELELVGMAHRELGAPVVERICNLQSSGRCLRWLGAVDGATLRERYAACDISTYCSLNEGFGLPVVESLAYGKPCVCTTCGALNEVSQGGGCLRLAGTDAPAIALGLRSVISDPALRARLEAEANARPIRTWADYASDIAAWAAETPKR